MLALAQVYLDLAVERGADHYFSTAIEWSGKLHAPTHAWRARRAQCEHLLLVRQTSLATTAVNALVRRALAALHTIQKHLEFNALQTTHRGDGRRPQANDANDTVQPGRTTGTRLLLERDAKLLQADLARSSGDALGALALYDDALQAHQGWGDWVRRVDPAVKAVRPPSVLLAKRGAARPALRVLLQNDR